MLMKFFGGTKLFMYECMMQQIPDMGRCSKEEKRLKAQYAGMLKEYMREYGYGSIIKRVLNSLDRFLFDEFIFCNEEHRDLFWKMHGKCVKTDRKLDFGKAAVIYLLSVDRVFGTILENYVSNPLYILPKMYNGSNGEEQYNLYHAVIRLTNEMNELIQKPDTDSGEVIDKIMELASAKFSICEAGDNSAITEKIKSELAILPKQTTVDGRVADKVIKSIKMHPDKHIWVQLINGKVFEKKESIL